MLASCWSGSSWSSHYHKGLTHHFYDCTSGELGQNQIQTTRKTNTNYKKHKYKLQKRPTQTTKKQKRQNHNVMQEFGSTTKNDHLLLSSHVHCLDCLEQSKSMTKFANQKKRLLPPSSQQCKEVYKTNQDNDKY